MGTSYNPKIVTDGLVLNLDPANVKSYPANQDPFVNNVSLMLDGESLTDKSQNAVTVTVQGAVTVDSSVKKIGNSSLKFAGALTDYLTVPSSSLFAFPGDFTIEFWTYANQWAQIGGATVYFCNNVLDQMQIGVYPNNSNIQLYLNGAVIQGALSASIVGRWMHIAVVRSGTTITIYEDGVSRASGTSSYSVPASLCYVGRQLIRSPTDYGANLNGYIDDFRVTKSARYTANFTPPTAPLSLPGVATDLTKNRSLQTLVGSGVTYSSSNNGCFTLDGSNGYGIINNTVTYGPTSNFTIGAWVNYISRPTSGAARRSVVEQSVSANDFQAIMGFPYNYSSSKMSLEIGKAGITQQTIYSLNTNNLNQWYYLVGVLKNGSADFYINGEYQGSVTYNATILGATANSKNYGIGGIFYNGAIVGPYSNCKVGPIQIYNRNLSANEILQNYNATKGRFG